MAPRFNLAQVLRYFVLPLIALIAIILCTWFILYLNRLDRRTATAKQDNNIKDEEQSGEVGKGKGKEQQQEMETEMDLLDPIRNGHSEPPTPAPHWKPEPELPVQKTGRHEAKKLGTTTTIEAGPSRWGSN